MEAIGSYIMRKVRLTVNIVNSLRRYYFNPARRIFITVTVFHKTHLHHAHRQTPILAVNTHPRMVAFIINPFNEATVFKHLKPNHIQPVISPQKILSFYWL